MFQAFQMKANSALKDVQDSLSSAFGSSEGDKSKVTRAQERAEMSAELDKKKAERAERKKKLTEQWAANKAGR